jgi:hypothetical protein
MTFFVAEQYLLAPITGQFETGFISKQLQHFSIFRSS